MHLMGAKHGTPWERFWRHVRVEEKCWIWMGYRDPRGYGRINVDHKAMLAHRLSYELHLGPIPEGLTIDHLCRVHSCVNPNHLEAVTALENWTRGIPGQTKGWCHRGHDLSIEANRRKDGRTVYCKACRRLKDRAAAQRRRLAIPRHYCEFCEQPIGRDRRPDARFCSAKCNSDARHQRERLSKASHATS